MKRKTNAIIIVIPKTTAQNCSACNNWVYYLLRDFWFLLIVLPKIEPNSPKNFGPNT